MTDEEREAVIGLLEALKIAMRWGPILRSSKENAKITIALKNAEKVLCHDE